MKLCLIILTLLVSLSAFSAGQPNLYLKAGVTHDFSLSESELRQTSIARDQGAAQAGTAFFLGYYFLNSDAGWLGLRSFLELGDTSPIFYTTSEKVRDEISQGGLGVELNVNFSSQLRLAVSALFGHAFHKFNREDFAKQNKPFTKLGLGVSMGRISLMLEQVSYQLQATSGEYKLKGNLITLGYLF